MQKTLVKLPAGFDEFTDKLLNEIESVEGYLTPKEVRFLALLAACPTAVGDVLEIGSFKGKSTVILAKSAQFGGNHTKIYAVDPMTAPSETDPDLRGAASSFEDFQKNIKAHEVHENIEFHQTFSYELAKTWDKPLRLLWIDGDHTYHGTKSDFEGFAPHLADGGIVAIHDVLHEFDGGIRVFMENVLLSPNFAASGFCGSIAWAQFRKNEAECRRFSNEKLALYKKLSRLIPFVVFKKDLSGWNKRLYKFYRSQVPHGAVNPQYWLRKIV